MREEQKNYRIENIGYALQVMVLTVFYWWLRSANNNNNVYNVNTNGNNNNNNANNTNAVCPSSSSGRPSSKEANAVRFGEKESMTVA